MTRPGLATAALLTALAGPLSAQAAQRLPQLSFMSGCWSGPYQRDGQAGTIEERYTAPSANVMLGTTRYLVGGRTTGYEFSLLKADSAGVALVPFPDGVRSPHEFRLTRLAGDTAVFEAPEHDYPKRIRYHRAADGSLVAAIDGGPGDANPREWRMRPVACLPGQPQFAGPPPAAGPDRSGRVLMYVTQTLNGLFLGSAVPAILGAEDATAYGLGLLLGPATGILFTKALNDARPVSLGQATAITWGGWWGLWNGLGLTDMGTSSPDAQDFFRNMTIGLVGGTTVGLVLARRPISAGDASLAAHATFWGTWYGSVVAVLANTNDAWPYLLVGGDAALLLGIAATKHVDVSAGRVWVVTAAGIVGLVAGLGLDLIVQPNDDNTAILIPAVTSLAGLGTGISLTRNFDSGRIGMESREPGFALLAVRDGRLRVGVPQPRPALLPREGADGRLVWTPGVQLTLLDLRHR